MSESLATVSYLGATILFILCLGGLSNQETARRGNLYGMIGMGIAVLATVFGPRVATMGLPWIVGTMAVGAVIGVYLARVVKMTQMPELVAFMHSLVGLAACLVGFASYIDVSNPLVGAAKSIHEIEIYVGILIGAVTFSGSVIAFGKLSGKIGGKPLLLPGRHLINLVGLLVVIYFGYAFLQAEAPDAGMLPLIVMTVIALLFGIHMVMAIGGADMPVVVSMLNSYSGWGGRGHWFHAEQRSLDRDWRAGGLFGCDPFVHHVLRNESQLHQCDRWRFRLGWRHACLPRLLVPALNQWAK